MSESTPDVSTSDSRTAVSTGTIVPSVRSFELLRVFFILARSVNLEVLGRYPLVPSTESVKTGVREYGYGTHMEIRRS